MVTSLFTFWLLVNAPKAESVPSIDLWKWTKPRETQKVVSFDEDGIHLPATTYGVFLLRIDEWVWRCSRETLAQQWSCRRVDRIHNRPLFYFFPRVPA